MIRRVLLWPKLFEGKVYTACIGSYFTYGEGGGFFYSVGYGLEGSSAGGGGWSHDDDYGDGEDCGYGCGNGGTTLG